MSNVVLSGSFSHFLAAHLAHQLPFALTALNGVVEFMNALPFTWQQHPQLRREIEKMCVSFDFPTRFVFHPLRGNQRLPDIADEEAFAVRFMELWGHNLPELYPGTGAFLNDLYFYLQRGTAHLDPRLQTLVAGSMETSFLFYLSFLENGRQEDADIFLPLARLVAHAVPLSLQEDRILFLCP